MYNENEELGSLCYNRFIFTGVPIYYYSLEEAITQYVENIYGDVNHPRVLQQDNDAPPHRAAATTQRLEDQGIQVMQ